MKSRNLVGERFGRLVVVERLENGKTPNGTVIVYWLCKCDCGKVVAKSSPYLKNSKCPSCGCRKSEVTSQNKLIDLSGQRYGRLTVLRRGRNKGMNTIWECLCDCGNKTMVTASNLKSGHTKSCGCYNGECVKNRSITHGKTNTRLYKIWLGMKDRCTNTNSTSRNNYLDRGITICDEWIEDPEVFMEWAYSNGYDDNLTIDRIDNNRGYSPDNCRWADKVTQARNKRNNYLITFNGKTQPLSAWVEEYGQDYDRVWARLRVLKWDIDRALTT